MKRFWIIAQSALLASCALTISAPLPAAEKLPAKAKPAALLPANRSIAEVVDHYVDLRLKEAKVTPAPQVPDEVRVRRWFLDLAGRIPTPREVREYVDSKDPKKAEALVDRLIDSPEFLDHQVNEFEWMLVQGNGGGPREYLATAFREKKTWDRMFRDLILADDAALEAKGSIDFIKARVKDQDQLTNDVSRVFFGVNISCAQCHDHPLVPDWKQAHFFGLKSFFVRTFDNGGFIGERNYGLVSYQTPKGEARQADLMFLTGLKPKEPKTEEPDGKTKKAEQDLLKKLADKKEAPPKPSFSRRAALADAALQPDQRQFLARSIVNRLIYRLYGYGLVMPVDQMHAANPASHPELLEWLARDTAEHGFELPRLIRGLVLSKTYSRSSRWSKGDRPEANLYAVGQVRPLAPQQYAASLKVATTDPEYWDTLDSLDEVSKKARGIAGSSREWARSFAAPSDDFQVSVTESLLLANDPKAEGDFLSDASDRLVARLKVLKTPEEQVLAAYSAICSRKPDAEEQAILVDYLKERKDHPLDAAKQMVWSLLTSGEMRFNY